LGKNCFTSFLSLVVKQKGMLAVSKAAGLVGANSQFFVLPGLYLLFVCCLFLLQNQYLSENGLPLV
jgi:hypothetical protein